MLWIAREVELVVDTDAPARFTVSGELPEQDVQARRSVTFDTSDTTTGRRVERFRLPGSFKFQLIQFEFVPTGVARLYSGRIFAKPLGTAAAWGWYALPIAPTPEGWQEAALPIEPTPEGWQEAALPIEPTPEGWQEAALPIEPTPEGWQEAGLPISPTPEAWEEAALPIPPTLEGWQEAPLPLPQVNPDPQWAEITVEDAG